MNHNGHPTGTVTTHDVARVHRERAATIAAFRPTGGTGGGVKAAITSPTPGSTLASDTVTFNWNAGSGAQAYRITAGSTVGGTQYHDSGSLGTAIRSRSISGLPINGSTVRVRLYTQFAGGWQHTDYSYTATTVTGGTKAQITQPVPGATFSGSTVTFQWTAGTNATGYYLDVGSSQGAWNYHDSGTLGTGTLSRTVTGLPTDGSTIYVRLHTGLPGSPSIFTHYNDYTYTAGSEAVKAVMSTPTPGSTLTNTSATFSWTTGTGVSNYWLYVGSNGAGSANIFSGGGAQTSRTVSGLPASGTLNVRLMSYISGGWQFNDYTYTMNAATKAVMTSPTPGSTITNTSATFNWTAGSGVSSYWLYVGTNGAGSANIFSGGGAQTSRTLSGLPASGTLNVRLMSYISGGWQFNDYTYTMNAGVKAVMTSPAPSSTLQNTTMMFQWTASQGSPGYWLMVGTNGPGSANIFNSGVTNTWRAVAGLPRVGAINVRLMTYLGGGWQHNDYVYNMAVPAWITTPAPGSTLPGSGVMFQWVGHASIGNYWLYVGTNGPGSANIFNSGVTNTWRWVGGIPTAGTVNVRLMTWVGGAWRFRDYTYQGGASGSGMALEAVGADEFSSLIQPISLE